MTGTPLKKLSRAKRLLKKGEYQKAFTLANEILQTSRGQDRPLLVVDALIVKAEASWRLGQLDDGFEAVAEGERLLEEIIREESDIQEKQIKSRKGDLLHHGGILYWYKGDLDQALEHYQQNLMIKEELGNRRGIAVSLNNLGLVYWSKGDFDRALEYYQRSLTISEELGNKRQIATLLSNLGNVYARKGDLDQALECQKRSLAIREELGDKYDISMSLINMGVVFQLKGDLDRALEHYQRSFVLSKEVRNKSAIALAINNLGSIFQLKGDLDQAVECFQKSLAIYKELGIKQDIALLLGNIGGIFRMKGNFADALEYYQQSLALFKALGNDPLTAIILFELVWVALERQDSALVQKYLQELQQINERIDNRIIDQRYRIAKALSLKASTRARHKLKAGEILEQVVDEEIGDHSLTVTAMIHLSDLLLSELKMTGEDELFEEIKSLTNRLLEIAQQQSSHSLLAETYLIQSKLALIELDMGQAKKLLTEAHRIAQEKGLHRLGQTVEHERAFLQSQMQKWDLIRKENPSRQELIALTGLDNFLEQMIQTTVANLIEEKGITEKEVPAEKYKLVYLDLLTDLSKTEKTNFRVGIAQIGLSQTGDLLNEFYQEQAPGLFGLRKSKVNRVRSKIKTMVKKASSQEIDLLVFPELTIDLNFNQLFEDVKALAKTHKMYIIPGSHHNPKTKQNLSVVISPDGVLWEQVKHIPATIHFENQRITEGIETTTTPQTTIISNTEFGRIAIVICRDFLDMDLRVELKNFEPPVDLIINPAFTPVTADFKAAHFDARRSIYAYCFFANVAEYGDSFIYTPEKERTERNIPAKEENLIYKDIDLFQLRSERKKWEHEQKKKRPFIQSTR